MILEKIQNLAATQLSLDPNQITLKTRLKEDLNLDSLDALELVMEVEKTFNIDISDTALQNFKTVEDIVAYIENHNS